MLLRALASTCIVLGLTSIGFGQVKLERKYQEGNSQTSEATTNLEQSLTIAGMETDTKAQTRTTVQTTVGKRDETGLLRIKEKIESLQISMEVMGMSYFFDSVNPDNKGNSALEILRDIHKVLARMTTTTVLDKENRIFAIEHDQDILSALSPNLQSLAKSQLDPEYLKKVANQQLEVLPSEPVNKGDSWQRTEIANFGAGQVMTFQTQYTYDGTVDKNGKTLDKISSKTLSVDYSLQDSPLPLQLKESKLKASESDGVILFDREKGRVLETTGAIRITGDITFSVNGMDLPSKLDLKMSSTLTVKP